MNKKTKKCGVFVAMAAVLLLSAALVTTCVEQLDTSNLTVPQGKQFTDFVPPPGMGYVVLNFGEASAGRTVKPITTGYTTLTDFGCFDVVFTPIPSGSDVEHPHLLAADVEGPFSLPAGEYSVAVFAYPSGNTTGEDPTVAIAWGQTSALDTLTVVAGSGTTTPAVALKEISTTTHGGTGTLKLALTNVPSAASFVAKLTVNTYPTPAGTPTIDALTVTSNLASYTIPTALDPGFYRVSLALSQDDKQSVTVREILHIYQGMDSTFAGALPTLKTNVYTITFNPNGGAAFTPAPSGITRVPHGWTIGGTSLGDPGSAPTNQPTRTNYDFVEWTITAGGAAWNFATGKPIKDMSLYAKWQLSTATGAGITVTIEFNDDGVPQIKVSDAADPLNAQLSSVSFTHNTPKVLKFTVTNASAFTGNYTWSASDDSVVIPITETGPTMELDIGSFDFLVGPLTIYVATTDPSESSSTTITIAE